MLVTCLVDTRVILEKVFRKSIHWIVGSCSTHFGKAFSQCRHDVLHEKSAEGDRRRLQCFSLLTLNFICFFRPCDLVFLVAVAGSTNVQSKMRWGKHQGMDTHGKFTRVIISLNTVRFCFLRGSSLRVLSINLDLFLFCRTVVPRGGKHVSYSFQNVVMGHFCDIHVPGVSQGRLLAGYADLEESGTWTNVG